MEPPRPLTRDLIHLIKRAASRSLGCDAASTRWRSDEQNREDEIINVLAALDEDMAEWLFDLLAEAASTAVEGMATMEMPRSRC